MRITIRFFASSTRSLTATWLGFGILIFNKFSEFAMINRDWRINRIQNRNYSSIDKEKNTIRINWNGKFRLNKRKLRMLGILILIAFLWWIWFFWVCQFSLHLSRSWNWRGDEWMSFIVFFSTAVIVSISIFLWIYWLIDIAIVCHSH
jgi:hypothetical protein